MDNKSAVEQQLKDLVVELSVERSSLQKEIVHLNQVISKICSEVVGEHEQISLEEVIARIHELHGAEFELKSQDSVSEDESVEA